MTVLNLQVGTGADDGYTRDVGSQFVATGTASRVGYFGGVCQAWYRFTGVSGLTGGTISAALLSLKGFSTVGTPLTKIRAEYAAAPVAVASYADHTSKTRTTAGVDWDTPSLSSSFSSAPDIATVIQELADNFDPTVIQILHDDDGTSTAATNNALPFMYEKASADAPKLDITYTAGGGGSKPKTLMTMGVG